MKVYSHTEQNTHRIETDQTVLEKYVDEFRIPTGCLRVTYKIKSVELSTWITVLKILPRLDTSTVQ